MVVSAVERRGLGALAWSVLALTVAVILWGAIVRATGSGAGCGSHWPDCRGELIPLTPAVDTLIEFVHRATSGLSLVAVLALAALAMRRHARGGAVWTAAAAAAALIVVEALVGAMLVLLGLTGDDDSIARAVVIALHLANTFLLLAALALVAWWGGGRPLPARRPDRRADGLLLLAMALLLVTSMAGAVTALGDTLFPAGTLAAGIGQDVSATAHFLVRLRVWHPALALVAAGVAALAVRRSPPPTAVLGAAVQVLLTAQLVAGAANVVLLAPVWLQVVHLLLADLLWIALVLLTADRLAEAPSARGAREASPAAAAAGS